MGEIEKNNLNQLEAEITILKHQTVQNIIEIGKRLIQAKELVPYGEWGNWLKDKADFSQERARQFMRVAEQFGDSKMSLNLSLDKMFMLTTIEPKEREEFIKDNPVEDMTTRELQQAIREKGKGRSYITSRRPQNPTI